MRSDLLQSCTGVQCVVLSVAVCVSLVEGKLPPFADYRKPQVLQLNGRVLISMHPPPHLGLARAVSVQLKNSNPVRIQLWVAAEPPRYKLLWHKRLQSDMTEASSIIFALKNQELVNLTKHHRVGILTERDPGPIPYKVVSQPEIALSRKPVTKPFPGVNDTVEFDSLGLPFQFAYNICITIDCSSPCLTTKELPTPRAHIIETEVPVNKEDKSTQSLPTTVPAVSDRGPTESLDLLQNTLVLGILGWLILVSVILLTVIFVLCCIHLRPQKNQNTRSHDDINWALYENAFNGNKQVTMGEGLY